MARRLQSQLARLVSDWPVNPARRGRDFGEYLQGGYQQRFAKLPQVQAERELRALQNIKSDHYRHKYARANNTTFTGDVGHTWGFSQLSSEQQKEFAKEGFFDRIIGRRAQSKHGPSDPRKR